MLDPLSLVEELDSSGEFESSGFSSVTELSRAAFWSFLGAALLGQVGLFAASLGLLLAAFRGQHALGGALFVGGAAALAGAVAVYRWFSAKGSGADSSD